MDIQPTKNNIDKWGWQRYHPHTKKRQRQEGTAMAKENNVGGCLIERKGKYYVVISYYVGSQRKQDTKSTGISVNSHKKREAEKIKERLVQEKEKELCRETEQKKKHPFIECFRRWVDYKSGQTEITTAWGYKSRSKAILKYFSGKDIMIEDLEPKDLLAYYEWALEHGRMNVCHEGSNTGLKRRTVRDHAALIKEFLNDAVVQGVIDTNPADKVQVPRVKEDNVKEKAYMDKGQAMAFLAYVKSEPMFEKLYCFSKLGLYYGLRRSELLGLRWGAIDFGKGEIAINHTVVRGEHGDIFRDNVKTKSSHRYLPLLESVKGDLLELMESQKELGIYSENGYVFTWEDGRVYSPDYMSKLFKKAVKRCGEVPEDLTLHGLRHSCCAILFEEGWELAKVQQWLGHSDISVTANIYNHVSKKWKNKHGEMVDGIFG